jgi:superfamily II DNA or RNA helicase
MKLYPHQNKAVEFSINNLFEDCNSLIVAATGAGKTIMMAEAIRRFTVGFKAVYGRYPHTLCLVHRTEIHGQNKAKFEKICPNIATSEISAERKSTHGLVHFGMVQTVVNIIDKLPGFDLIVIDETHHAAANTYKMIIESNSRKVQKAYLLGVTATPNRGDKLPLVELFSNFYQITSRFLIDSHYLVRPKFVDLSPSFGDEKGRLNKNLLHKEIEIGKMVDEYLKHKESGKSVIFTPSHEFCAIVKRALEERGRKVSYLYNNIEQTTRENELRNFETSSDVDEIINVDILTEGYDFPQIQNIVEFDTNGSETQWLQKVGRGLRTHLGKKQCTVIDFGGNIEMYPDCEVSVNLEGALKKKSGKKLTLNDFFGKSTKVHVEAKYEEAKSFKPYAPPKKFETLNDADAGIVYVCCSSMQDAIIVKSKKSYTYYHTDKTRIVGTIGGEFDALVAFAIEQIKKETPNFFETEGDAPISDMQLKRLAVKYPTTTLDFYTANCLLCWETWKGEIWK